MGREKHTESAFNTAHCVFHPGTGQGTAHSCVPQGYAPELAAPPQFNTSGGGALRDVHFKLDQWESEVCPCSPEIHVGGGGAGMGVHL